MISSEYEQLSVEDPRNNGLEIQADVADCLNYASWQNSVPLVRSLRLLNTSEKSHKNLRLEASSSPAFLRPKQWMLNQFHQGSDIDIRDRDLELDPDYLNGLDEAERGIVTFTLSSDGTPVATAHCDVRVLARDEWGGLNSGGELLAAYVMPNDPAIANILKIASEVLAKYGHSTALDGYQSGDPQRTYMLVAAIWSAVASKSLTYANPPRSFEAVGQKTRRPSVVLSSGLATCLDSTLMFAAAIEAVGLNPVIVMVQGHCFAGAWLIEKTLGKVVDADCAEIRKAIAARELITFETTLITHRPAARFEDAIKTAAASTRESQESQYQAAIDVARARMAQIRPLASHQSTESDVDQEVFEIGPLPLPATSAIDLPSIGEVEQPPATPEGRIDRWQRKLLDLSLRNRLLNFKPNKQSVPIVCPDISILEDRLAAGGKLRLISLAEHNPLGQRDAEVHRQRTNQDLEIEFVRQALERNEVSCQLEESELFSRLTTIYRNVRNDLAEGGSNTLFLAVGFLRWKRPEESKYYRAPLLLVPVMLTRKSALSAFHLIMHEDEVRFNATLIQLLKKDFDRDLSFFESELPRDESGVDVPLILERMRREVREIPGFEVVDETALATFSFAKYLMWKDLVDRIDSLKQNRVVRHLTETPDQSFESNAGAMPGADEVDVRYEPQHIVHPLPADSSQLAAVMAASEGQDFVLVGPPGTGKSQTIANIIAQCIAVGKTVLFVAEKTAALDVVYRRLREHGLGDCCLELHSNKAERRKFLDQLGSAWQNNRKTSKNDWVSVSERLKIRRDQLNAYVSSIHRIYPNGWTAFEAMGVCVQGSAFPTPAFDWADSTSHDRKAYEGLASTVNKLALTFEGIDETNVLPAVAATRWSPSWEQSLLTHSATLKIAATALRNALINFTKLVGLAGRTDCSIAEMDSLSQLAAALNGCATEDVRLLFHKRFADFPEAAKQLRRAIESYLLASDSSAADYRGSLVAIPLDEIEQSWRRANACLWPISWLSKRKVAKLLQTYTSNGKSNPLTDIAAIRQTREHLAAINGSLLAEQTTHYKATETDMTRLETQLRKAHALRQSIVATGKLFGGTDGIAKSLHHHIDGKHADAPVFAAATEFVTAVQSFLEASGSFSGSAGKSPLQKEAVKIIEDSISAVEQIQLGRSGLQRWTAWCEVKKAACTAGLSAFVQAMEDGKIATNELAQRFRLAYARWWIQGVMECDEILRSFQRFQHEDAIKDFRELDEQARSLAAARAKQSVIHDLPQLESVPRRSELGLLRHQLGLQRPSKSIREVISSMPEVFGKLAPCLLMSPLSIAQYLPVQQSLFDVVIFDEASQITTWDAVGAIARGRQTIIVGDPKQLPPTNFFGRADDDAGNDELEDHEKDLESILDEAKASGLPTLQLNWHYRSRHESLIAFSNWNYYGNKLVTFPSAESEDRGVSLVHLPDAVYDRGKSRTNRQEAEAIVADAVARMQRNLQLPKEQRLTFGVITFNTQQQTLIQDLFDQAQRDNPELDWYFSEERIEPTLVKNLENVQGDERDVMLFSITFGRDISGKDIPLTFGALNRDGGERRLNVAITRARQELIVYSSFKSDQLYAERSQARGVKDLKAFLDYAEKGPEAIAARIEGSMGEFDSPFEEAVAEALGELGWQIVPQVGVSGFRVDLGIVHPDKPGAYLAGVECDGATYHRSAVARDRDKTRQQVLENLGWNIIRIWSPDWWYDAHSAAARVNQQLADILSKLRSVPEPELPDASAKPCPAAELLVPEALVPEALDEANAEALDRPTESACISYARFKLTNAQPNQERFYDSSYDADLRTMAMMILKAEAPIRDDVLAKQIARAHGFARTGTNIRARILSLLNDVSATDEATGRFLWASPDPLPVIEFRNAKSAEDRRNVDEIALAELIGLIRSNKALLMDDDPALAVARYIGFARLSQTARDRIEEAIALGLD